MVLEYTKGHLALIQMAPVSELEPVKQKIMASLLKFILRERESERDIDKKGFLLMEKPERPKSQE